MIGHHLINKLQHIWQVVVHGLSNQVTPPLPHRSVTLFIYLRLAVTIIYQGGSEHLSAAQLVICLDSNPLLQPRN